MKNSSTSSSNVPGNCWRVEGGGESDRPLISGKQALIQEFLMADPLSRSHSHGRKTASINLAGKKGVERRFAKKRRETMDGRCEKLQKGGQRVRER